MSNVVSMNEIDQFKQRRLERIENNLRQSGAKKCYKCIFWMGVEYIDEDNLCNECKNYPSCTAK